VNRELILAFLRQRLTSIMRLALLSITFFFPLLVFAFAPASPISLLTPNAANFALILSAGMIGQDVSAGVLQLVFARPLSRAEYVFSRWGAAAIGAAMIMMLQVALVAAICAARGAPRQPSEWLAFGAESALQEIGVVSVMTLFSALAPALADLGLLVISTLMAALMSVLGQAVERLGFLVRISEELQRFTSPQIPLGRWLEGDAISWFTLASYLSTIALCLALAIVIMNRKELSYASG
jgi:ABC-type transport system involved in multi-copper enzyme maturation permease subunit